VEIGQDNRELGRDVVISERSGRKKTRRRKIWTSNFMSTKMVWCVVVSLALCFPELFIATGIVLSRHHEDQAKLLFPEERTPAHDEGRDRAALLLIGGGGGGGGGGGVGVWEIRIARAKILSSKPSESPS